MWVIAVVSIAFKQTKETNPGFWGLSQSLLK